MSRVPPGLAPGATPDEPPVEVKSKKPKCKAPGKFSPGDTCYLKSGSPKMVVLGPIDDEILVCWVHYDTGRPYKEHYPAYVLQRDWK